MDNKNWYEVSPFLYTVLGGYMLGRAESVAMAVSSILLLFAVGTITILRRKHALQLMQRAMMLSESDDALAESDYIVGEVKPGRRTIGPVKGYN